MTMFRTGLLVFAVLCPQQVFAHDISWPPGMSRLIGSNSCTKPPCHRRVSFASSVPHEHVGDGICIGKGAAGYTAGRRFRCDER
ncbi:MAG: hypothetical protein H6876_10590 [Hyphomicrobiaceae bacterium]|nr:hypothetical protein [Hyphomicrobiaceae bacterium]MCB1514791.1 hypothetical protein [Hyphomicrobiaceae bacterium]MCC0008550.1 hypothetical protein [Hyphomicrobiaceae bacterium]